MITAVDLIDEVVNQDGDTYTTEYGYNRPSALNKPETVEKSSNVSTAPRVTQTEYLHNTSKWVLGLPKKVEINNRLISENFYDSYGRVSEKHRYGALHMFGSTTI